MHKFLKKLCECMKLDYFPDDGIFKHKLQNLARLCQGAIIKREGKTTHLLAAFFFDAICVSSQTYLYPKFATNKKLFQQGFSRKFKNKMSN